MSDSALPIALQLYTMRALDAPEDEVLAHVAAAGYAYVETVHRTDRTAQAWKQTLAQHGLSVISGHVPMEALTSDRDGTIQFYADLGTQIIAIPIAPPKLWAGEASGASDWQRVGAELNTLGEACRAGGLQLLYHNHWQEMAVYDGQLAIDWLLGETDPVNVGLEPDFAWIVKGGADPVALLQRYRDRCPCVHMKDLAPQGTNEDQMGLADVGHGELDWSRILPAAQAAGAQWYIVEHDMPKSHVDSITRSYDFIASRFRA